MRNNNNNSIKRKKKHTNQIRDKKIKIPRIIATTMT